MPWVAKTACIKSHWHRYKCGTSYDVYLTHGFLLAQIDYNNFTKEIYCQDCDCFIWCTVDFL